MGNIKIDESDLLDLLDDHEEFRAGYLDRQTGEILTVFSDCAAFDQDDITERFDEDPDRYLMIDPIDSRDGFRIMERFAESLPEGENRLLLSKVLSWKSPFSNFKSALRDMGELREQWFAFHREQLREYAVEWLEAEGVDAELVPYGAGAETGE